MLAERMVVLISWLKYGNKILLVHQQNYKVLKITCRFELLDEHQQVAAAALKLEPAPQQLNQLLLPLPWLNVSWLNLACLGLVRGLPGREVEADG